MILEAKSEDTDYDTLTLRVFLKALEIIGGPRKLFKYRNLMWIPSLMEACYAVVLKEEEMKPENKIAEIIGITKQTVRNMLTANPEPALKKLERELENKEIKIHTIGGLAKLAYKEVKEGKDNLSFVLAVSKVYLSQLFDTEWPVEMLASFNGLDFPISDNNKEILSKKIGGFSFKGKDTEELIDMIKFPIKSHADLLYKLREAANGS